MSLAGGRSTHLAPAVAGTWYPSDETALREQVQGLLRHQRRSAPKAAPPPQVGLVRAVIAPHAGFDYSGQVAAAAFSRIVGSRPARVILIGPSHHAAFDGAAVPHARSYRTPLGAVPFDARALDRLSECPSVEASDRPFLPEHSLEVELPFLQEALHGDWELIPLLIGAGGSAESLRQVADALRPEMTNDTLLVVSSDFTHYGLPFGYLPFTDDIPERIRRLDMGAVESILNHAPKALRDYIKRTGATICGKDAIDILLQLLPATAAAQLCDYDCSGNITGDWDVSVSYASLIFHAAPARADHV